MRHTGKRQGARARLNTCLRRIKHSLRKLSWSRKRTENFAKAMLGFLNFPIPRPSDAASKKDGKWTIDEAGRPDYAWSNDEHK